MAGQQVNAPQPRLAQPQRVAPGGTDPQAPAQRPSNRKFILAGAGAALVVLLVVLVVAIQSNSAESQIEDAIDSYTQALSDGDLATLRSSTYGTLHEYYQGLSEEQFNGVHQQSSKQGGIPEVDSIDTIRVTDSTAIAQATVQTKADSATTARTFDLRETEDGWKVCDPPATS